VEAVVVIVETAVAVETKLLQQLPQAMFKLQLVLLVKVLTAAVVVDSNKVVVAVALAWEVELLELLVETAVLVEI
tara:strand:- start:110 stop:334 length:225 start_codon:yes stop_codon:yes gene_type:complete